MITAVEAAKQAEENQMKQLAGIYKTIEGQASIGRRRVCTDSYLTDDQQKELESNGYKITKLEISRCHLIEW